MEIFDRQAPLFARSGLKCSQATCFKQSTVKIYSAIAILLLVGAANSGHSDDAMVNIKGVKAAQWTLANACSGTNAQMLVSGRAFRINIDGFNRQRDIDIAKDSRKLLSLAIALKAELDQNPGENGSPAAVSKVEAIEKLARDVKEKMQLTPELSPF